MDYVELRKEVIEAGLLDRQYGYYALKFATTFGMLALSIFILVKVNNFAFQLLDAVFLAFVFVQFGMLMHDAGHQQIFKASWKNTAVGLITGNLITGMSSGSWSINHDRHHSSPNDVDEGHALAKSGDRIVVVGQSTGDDIDALLLKYK